MKPIDIIILAIVLSALLTGCAVRVHKTTDTIDLRTGKSTETVTECYAFEMVSVEDPCKKKPEVVK